jgi:hypothetical protein
MTRIKPSEITIPDFLDCGYVAAKDDENARAAGIGLSRQQAVDLATVLLLAAKAGEWIEVGATQIPADGEGPFPLTVTVAAA